VATPDEVLRRVLAEQPSRPLITQYDDRTGERVELSVVTVDNWVAKTANLLQAAGVDPGATASVLLPAHWQTATILLGCWRAGVAVDYRTPGDAPQVVFATADRVPEALETGAEEVWALSLAPLAAPLREVPTGAADYALEVRGQGDRFASYAPIDPEGPGLTGERLSLSQLVDLGSVTAAGLSLATGARLLVQTDDLNQPAPLEWLLAPLVADASLVLLRYPDVSKIEHVAEIEKVTARL
jgi:uncharacterized protein (TIGR03089 family)